MKDDCGILFDLREIGGMIASAHLAEAVRKEVRKVVGSRARVTNGRYSSQGRRFDVVVIDLDGDEVAAVARRVRSRCPQASVHESVVERIVGVSAADGDE